MLDFPTNRGQSGPIGVAMTVAIVVTLVAVASMAFFNLGSIEDSDPETLVSSSEVGENGNIVIMHQRGEAFDTEDLEIQVTTPDRRQGSITGLPFSNQRLPESKTSGEVSFDNRDGGVSSAFTDDSWEAGEVLAFRLDETFVQSENVEVRVVDTSTNRLIVNQEASVALSGTVSSTVEESDNALSGVVRDGSGNTVSRATVHLENADGDEESTNRETVTDSNGEYSFENVGSGENTLWIEPEDSSGLAYSGRVVIESGLDGDLTVTEEPDRWVSVSENEDGTIENSEVGFNVYPLGEVTLSGVGSDMTASVQYENPANAESSTMTISDTVLPDEHEYWLNGTDVSKTIDVEGNAVPQDQELILTVDGNYTETVSGGGDEEFSMPVVTTDKQENGTHLTENNGDAVSLYVDGNREPRNVSVMFEDNYESEDMAEGGFVDKSGDTFTLPNTGTLSTTNDRVTFTGESLLVGSGVLDRTRDADGSFTVDGNYQSEGDVTITGTEETSTRRTSETITQDPTIIHEMALRPAVGPYDGAEQDVYMGSAYFDARYDVRIPWDLNKDYQEPGADSEFELAINHDQAVKSWNGLGYWDVYRDGVWEDSIYLNEGESATISYDAYCQDSGWNCEIEGGPTNDALSAEQGPSPETTTIDVDGNSATDVEMEFTGREHSKEAWVFEGDRVAGDAGDGTEDASRGTIMEAPEDGEYKLDISWYALANSGGLWGGCCFAGDTEFELHAGDRTLADESMSVYDYEEEDASGHETMTVTLEKGEAVHYYMYNHEGGYAEINSEETAVTKVSGDKDTGSVEAELNGQTEYTRYLNNGETDTVVFENIEPGTHEVTVNPRNGQEVDVAYEWQETFATEDPRIDLNGDGNWDVQYNGLLREGETAEFQDVTVPSGDHTVDATGSGPGYDWEYDYGDYDTTEDPVIKNGDGEVVAEYTGVLTPGDRTSIGIDSIDPQSTVDRNVSTAVAPVTTDFRYTVQSGTRSPEAIINGAQMCDESEIVSDGDVTCNIPDGVLTTEDNSLNFTADEGELNWEIAYTERAQAESVEISLPDGSTATYPEDFEESGSITLNESLTVGNNTISVDTPVENNMETEVNLSVQFTEVTKPEVQDISVKAGDGEVTEYNISEDSINRHGALIEDVDFEIAKSMFEQGVNDIRIETTDGTEAEIEVTVVTAGGELSTDDFN